MKLAGWLLCACILNAQTVTVTGRVTNAITHEPIQAVSVLLYSGTSPSGANTDSSGSFRIPLVKPGIYRLFPSRVGFESPASEIRIDAGIDPHPLDLTMLPWPCLQGTVLDPERKPVARVRVRATRAGNAPGNFYEDTTDAAGRYTLKQVSPGQYQILATPPSNTNDATPTELAPTWFPDISDQRYAMPVTFAPGHDLFGHDIILRVVPVFRLSGKVVDERGDPAAGATVKIATPERTATTRDDGTFDLARVRPGEWTLRAESKRGDVTLRGFTNVAVGGHDLENLAIRMAAPVPFSGVIELNGQPGHPCQGDAILSPVDGQGERAQAEFTETGIRFERAYPGRYRLNVLPGWTVGRHYLDSVHLGERDITLDEFEIVPGMLPFRVALKTGGGQLRGTVEHGNGGLVVLIPREERLRFRPFIVTAFFEGTNFAIENVRPGDYYAVALQGSFNADEMQNPLYARPYLEAATAVRLERGSTSTLTLAYVKLTLPQ